ncbi:Vacuolar iron transporter 1 [Vitis vinifera]|uniref:Vacuolar iron transporter n=1 Tax=Vitis vinifera TaxID=29760 RepID=A0A438DGV2_VITVI|nr:Vacuolar iron transporter 1 [Vitis vinifera]
MESMDGSGKQKLLLDDHKERHFTAGEIVRDIIIGVSDGLTVPFALAAVLTSSDASRYLAAKSEADHYMRELKREQEEIITVPDIEAAEIEEILSQYGLEPHESAPVVNALRRRPQAWLDFMMKRFVPLIPYMLVPRAEEAVIASVVLTLVALLIFGYGKGRFTGNKPLRSALQTALIGALASAAAFGMAKAVRAIPNDLPPSQSPPAFDIVLLPVNRSNGWANPNIFPYPL